MKPLYKGRGSILQVSKTPRSSVFELYPVIVQVVISVIFTDVKIKIHLIHTNGAKMLSVEHTSFPHCPALKELIETSVRYAKFGKFPGIEPAAAKILSFYEFAVLNLKVKEGSIDVVKDTF